MFNANYKKIFLVPLNASYTTMVPRIKYRLAFHRSWFYFWNKETGWESGIKYDIKPGYKSMIVIRPSRKDKPISHYYKALKEGESSPDYNIDLNNINGKNYTLYPRDKGSICIYPNGVYIDKFKYIPMYEYEEEYREK